MCQQKVRRLQERIERVEEETGVHVSDEEDLKATMKDHSPSVQKYEPDSFLRIFWEQQQKASSLKNAKSMKWALQFVPFQL